ncbi:MAG: hypothetical protein WCW77_04825 [Patescibacteria group bacterium]|jgi:hypothetical protein
MKSKIFYIILGIAIVAIGIVVLFPKKQSPAEVVLPAAAPSPGAALKQCPDEWIDNQMPSVGARKTETQYFILDGKRREVNEFDAEWVQKNCNVNKQTVH